MDASKNCTQYPRVASRLDVLVFRVKGVGWIHLKARSAGIRVGVAVRGAVIHLNRRVYKVEGMTGKRLSGVGTAAASSSSSSSSLTTTSASSPNARLNTRFIQAMRVRKDESRNVLFLLCFLMKTSAAMKNDGTEIVYPHMAEDPGEEPADEAALNSARGGGRGAENAPRDRADPGLMGCRELRSTKYISDGQCTSINPIKELVCAGECLAAQVLPNWIGGYGKKQRSRRGSQDWRCVNDKTRTERIQLQCQDGSTRTYKITVVTGCKCKRYLKQHNESANKSESITQRQPTRKLKSKRKHRNSKVTGNWHESES